MHWWFGTLPPVKRNLKFTTRTRFPPSLIRRTAEILAVASGTVAKLLDPATGAVGQEFAGHKGTVRCLAFTPDGKQLATGANDHTVNLWNVATGQVVHTFSDFQGNVVSVAISPDGKWLATAGGREDVAKLFNLEQLDQMPRTCEIPRRDAGQVIFSADSRYLIIPHGAIIDIAAGTEFLRFTHFWDANCAALSPDGQWLALSTQYLPIDLLSIRPASDENQRRQIAALIEQFQSDDYGLREAATQKLADLGIAALPQLREQLTSSSPEVRVRCRRLVERLQRAEFSTKLVGHTAQPRWVAFSPDSKLLASGDVQGIVKLWNVIEAKEVATLEPN